MRKLPAILMLGLIACGCYRPPAEDALVGQSEAAVQSTLGKPSSEFSGHYGNPPMQFAQRFTGEIKTEVFTKTGGNEYVSFEKRSATWVAICNSWLPKGSVF